MTCRKLVDNLVDSDYKLGFAGVPASKPVLTVAEYLILAEVLHDATVDNAPVPRSSTLHVMDMSDTGR